MYTHVCIIFSCAHCFEVPLLYASMPFLLCCSLHVIYQGENETTISELIKWEGLLHYAHE